MKTNRPIIGAALLLLILNLVSSTAIAQGTAFTYQGQLQNNGGSVNGGYDLRFTLYAVNQAGVAIAGPITNLDVAVSNGLFTTTIDFGPGVFIGASNWLDIAVETNGAGLFTELTPRQQLTPVPYAQFAQAANAGDLSGILNLSTPEITSGGLFLLLADNNGNFFAGPGAGNGAMSGSDNTANGYNALIRNGSGSDNTANGFEALNSNSSGSGNVANGAAALFSNQIGSGNTADGDNALYANVLGSDNTADGLGALAANIGGSGNTANGAYALYANTSGQENTASGFNALYRSTNGMSNTADGVGALYSDTSGSFNTAGGQFALESDTTGSNNVALGFNAGVDITTGSYNIDIGNFGASTDTNFIRIGTPGSQTAAYIAGTIYGDGGGLTNLSAGQLSGVLNLPTPEMTYGGSIILYSSSNSLQNFFVGPSAGNPAGDDGAQNAAIGYQALFNDTTGSQDTAGGAQALYSNTSGNYNTANGYGALFLNTNGSDNTADGFETLNQNTSGSVNMANGYQALYHNTSGNYNTGNGGGALFLNTSGSYNTADGHNALEALGGGTNNIALGFNAGSAFSANESSNIDIGNVGVGGESKIIRIGIPGIQTATYLSGTVYANGVALTSDRNAKEHFASINSQAVLAKVAALPVTEWNYKDNKAAEHIGPMAQDFHAAFGLDGADDKHISVVDEGGVALAAIQGLNEKLEAQTADNAALKQENNLLAKRLDELEAEVRALARNK